ncbi:unnamed protein product [Fraxinus pennsylvanica]|uniref:Uncharacterized protein n=1 Tax=Fraxinus pennsylvanica TaxID=56036 RepID=A0AAD1Z0X1_9LAMI|nr:unnamed protein product [Fraxinus pennsylvanica]
MMNNIVVMDVKLLEPDKDTGATDVISTCTNTVEHAPKPSLQPCTNTPSPWCRQCHFDIHLECILVPIVQCPQKPLENSQTTQRGIPMFDQGIPFRPPPQYSGYYGYGFPYGYGYGPGHNMYNGPMYGHPVYPNNFVQQNQL